MAKTNVSTMEITQSDFEESYMEILLSSDKSFEKANEQDLFLYPNLNLGEVWVIQDYSGREISRRGSASSLIPF